MKWLRAWFARQMWRLQQMVLVHRARFKPQPVLERGASHLTPLFAMVWMTPTHAHSWLAQMRLQAAVVMARTSALHQVV